MDIGCFHFGNNHFWLAQIFSSLSKTSYGYCFCKDRFVNLVDYYYRFASKESNSSLFDTEVPLPSAMLLRASSTRAKNAFLLPVRDVKTTLSMY